jgi:hypothetical protein
MAEISSFEEELKQWTLYIWKEKLALFIFSFEMKIATKKIGNFRGFQVVWPHEKVPVWWKTYISQKNNRNHLIIDYKKSAIRKTEFYYAADLLLCTNVLLLLFLVFLNNEVKQVPA